MSSASENAVSIPKVQPWHREAVDLLAQILSPEDTHLLSREEAKVNTTLVQSSFEVEIRSLLQPVLAIEECDARCHSLLWLPLHLGR